MGHDIELVDENGSALAVNDFKGGGLCIKQGYGVTDAHLSVTYNYAWFFYKFMDADVGIKRIYGLTGKQAQPIIQDMINELCSTGMGNGDCTAEHDYWIPTPANVNKILRILYNWCEQHPNGTFKGD